MKNSISYRGSIAWNLLDPSVASTRAYAKNMAINTQAYKSINFSAESPQMRRVSQADAAAAYQPQGLGTYKEVSVKGPVIEPPNFNMSSASSGVNEVTKWQEIYKKTKAPVYLLRGGRDQVMFRGLLVAIGGGMCYTFYNMYLMFTNQLKKKER